MVDHTRRRDMEEAKVLGLVRQITKPVILVINKIDYQDTTYIAQYRFLKDEFDMVFEISALKESASHLSSTRSELLPRGQKSQKRCMDTLFILF